MQGVREFIRGKAGRAVAIAFACVAAVAMFVSARDMFGSSTIGSLSADRWFICTETGKPFRYQLTIDSTLPAPSPHSGKNTGVEAELCYWTADGGAKDEPTPVLLITEPANNPPPTFCPDCSRRVVGRNPSPEPGRTPPPTKADYLARAGKRQ
ncbi:MAG: hypothetical protein WBD40_18040 [Tepidisphaeraceae bacterium]